MNSVERARAKDFFQSSEKNSSNNNDEGDKKRKLAELQAQIQSKLAAGILKDKDGLDKNKPVPLLLDSEGRAIDVSGKQLMFPSHQPTLKANIRAQKKVDYKPGPIEKPAGHGTTKPGAKPLVNKYFDERLGGSVKSKVRKPLKFNDPGKYVTLAQRQRKQAQLDRLQQEIAEKARKTGISTAARLARLSGTVSLQDKEKEYIPQTEWWDSLLLEDRDREREVASYDCIVKEESITNLIEHPIQLRCPTDPPQPDYLPVFLTKEEKKKLRRQTRREAWKEMQEKIRLGLEAPPPAKVRISNLMRVLGVEAVQDPTKIEAHVRQQMLKRQRNHLEANASRKLTPEQISMKKTRKLAEDTSLGVHVAVYRIDDLSNQSKKFKVETNGKQLQLTGCILLYRECSMVVVEGGPKQQKKYKKLMLSRIKWSEDFCKDKEDTPNKCTLVWEGTVKDRSFNDLKFKSVLNESLAREYFKKLGVQQYWDLTLSGTVLETSEF